MENCIKNIMDSIINNICGNKCEEFNKKMFNLSQMSQELTIDLSSNNAQEIYQKSELSKEKLSTSTGNVCLAEGQVLSPGDIFPDLVQSSQNVTMSNYSSGLKIYAESSTQTSQSLLAPFFDSIVRTNQPKTTLETNHKPSDGLNSYLDDYFPINASSVFDVPLVKDQLVPHSEAQNLLSQKKSQMKNRRIGLSKKIKTESLHLKKQ